MMMSSPAIPEATQVSDTSETSSKSELKDAKLPVHVLMLPPGSHAFHVDHRKPRNEKSANSSQSHGCDLIDQRWLHRERKSGSSGANADVSFYSSDQDEQSGAGAVWIGATPLEIAMIDCCTCDERNDEEHTQWGTGNEMAIKSRSRLKRKRDDEDDYLPSDEEDDRKVVAQIDEAIHNLPNLIRGSIKRGREAHFLSIMARFCNTLSDRSLALAILTRTVQADKDEEIIHKHRQYLHDRLKQGFSSSDSPANTGTRSPEVHLEEEEKKNNMRVSIDEKGSIEADGVIPSDIKSPGKLPPPIMTTFLTIGGMKVLKQWLQDAFTSTVSATPRLVEPVSIRNKSSSTAAAKKRGSSAASDTSKVSLVASRTSALLPVILKLLQDMPFQKALVYETQINKQIRKLKKGIDKSILKFQTENKEHSSLERFLDPIFGSFPVFQIQKAVESLMSTWKEAVTLSNKTIQENCEVPEPDSFAVLRQVLTERFEASFPNFQLAHYPALAPVKAKSPASLIEHKIGKNSVSHASFNVKKIATHEDELKAAQARLDAQRKIMEQYRQKMVESNNKTVEEASGRKNDASATTRRVTWADISRKGVLVEVREYIVDRFYGYEEFSHDFSSEIHEDQHDLERRRLLQNDRPRMMYLEDEDEDDDIFL